MNCIFYFFFCSYFCIVIDHYNFINKSAFLKTFD